MSDHPYCRGESCGMQIQWVECVRRDGTLSKMPLDVDAADGVSLTVLDGYLYECALEPADLKGKFVFVTVGGLVRAAVCGDTGPFYTGHHATCVNADDFRK